MYEAEQVHLPVLVFNIIPILSIWVRAGGNKTAFGLLSYACVLAFGPGCGPQFPHTRAHSAQTSVRSALFFTWRMVPQRVALALRQPRA